MAPYLSAAAAGHQAEPARVLTGGWARYGLHRLMVS